MRWSCIVVLGLGVLAPLANTVSLTPADPPRETANAFTSLNAAVLLALLLGVLGTTGTARITEQPGSAFRRAAGANARAYGLVGVACVLVLAAFAAGIALPLIHGRGLASPASGVISDYIARETVAGLRLAFVGVALGLLAGGRWRALISLGVFLAVEGVAEGFVPLVRDYGPIGALNAFSDPSHHHQLSVSTGGLIALGWALAALVGATVVAEGRRQQLAARSGRANDVVPGEREAGEADHEDRPAVAQPGESVVQVER
jgi:hypothetical protein